MFVVMGDLSGIQDYLLDIADEEGQQSRRLRARSFFLQALAELAALRMLKSVGWYQDRLLLCAAGKFVLTADQLDAEQKELLYQERDYISRWLREKMGASVRFSLVICEGQEINALYDSSLQALQQEKMRPLSQILSSKEGWNVPEFIGQSIHPPCAICRRRTASVKRDDTGDMEARLICPRCAQDMDIGEQLPKAKWLVVSPDKMKQEADILGLNLSFHSGASIPKDVDAWRIYDLTGEPSTGNRDPLVAPRLLARHTPSGLDFDAIAEKSTGAPYLGVLKMDADQLGQAINRVLVKARDFSPLKEFSDKLDRFFASRLDRELSKDEWSDIYTVFSGGDDLLLVGPWDTLFQYAGHVQKLFSDLFHAYGLTISAGMAVVTRKHPIRRAVEQAEDLLERAKREAAPGASEGRDQFSAFGQIWKWKEHDGIVHNAKCLTNWVTGNTAERGWLHTLLRLAEEQKAQHLSSARLAYHIARNYPRSTDNDPNKQALRRWIDQIAQDFEKKERLETRYLPVIVRYALTATRARTGG